MDVKYPIDYSMQKVSIKATSNHPWIEGVYVLKDIKGLVIL